MMSGPQFARFGRERVVCRTSRIICERGEEERRVERDKTTFVRWQRTRFIAFLRFVLGLILAVDVM